MINLLHRFFIKAKTEITTLLAHSATRQSLILYLSHMLLMIFGVVTLSINSRVLGPDGYGVLSFVLTITEFAALFFSFGFFRTCGLLIAKAEERQAEKEITGSGLIVGICVGITFSIAILIFSFFVDRVFRTNVGHIFRLFSSFFIVMPLTGFLIQILTGTNRIVTLSALNIAPKSLYLIVIGLLLLILGVGKLSLEYILFVNLGSLILTVLLFVVILEPSFKNIGARIGMIWRENRAYGFQVYLGHISDKTTYRLDGIFVSYFVNTTSLGFYNLATTLTGPIVLLSQSIATTMFRGFASDVAIKRKILFVNLTWLVFSSLLVSVIGRHIVALLLGPEFSGINELLVPLAFTRFFQGMYQQYNMFLAAKGRGKWLRNISISQSLFNIVGNFVFIYYMGARGAAIASLIAAFLAYCGHIFYYGMHHKDLSRKCSKDRSHDIST